MINKNRHICKYDKNLATLTSSSPLTLTESKLVFNVIAQIDIKDGDFKTYNISASELYETIRLELRAEARKISKIKNRDLSVKDIAKDKATQLEIFCKNLKNKSLNVSKTKEEQIDDNDNENSVNPFKIVSWFNVFRYAPEQDLIKCEIDRNLKPFLLEFKNNHFKKVDVRNIFRFKSKYSHKFYLLLKTNNINESYVNINEFKTVIPLLWFREWLGLEDYEYPLYGNFKQRILEQVKKDLSEFAEVTFEYEEIKTKKAVTHLKIKVKYKDKKDISNPKDCDETETECDYTDEKKSDTDIENQDIKYFFENKIIIRENEKNFKLISIEEDKYRGNKITITMNNIENESIVIKEFSYKSKEKLRKDFVIPNHFQYKIWFSENCSDFETKSFFKRKTKID